MDIPLKTIREYKNYLKTALHSDNPFLDLIISYIVRQKTERYRPYLFMLSAKLFGSIGPSTFAAAANTELLYIATLIHENVDNESFKKKSLFFFIRSVKSKLAVLIGDYLLAKGLLFSVNRHEFTILRYISGTVKSITEGIFLRISHTSGQVISKKNYFEYLLKNPSALISCCCYCGALSASSSNKNADKIRLFGQLVGMAAQIKADCILLQQKTKNKRTWNRTISSAAWYLPVIHALEQANDADRNTLLKILPSQYSKYNAEILTTLIKKYYGYDYALKEADTLINEAIQCLDFLPSTRDKSVLITYVRNLHIHI